MAMSGTVAVVDYGMGNLHSVAKALERVGGAARVIVGHTADEIEAADRVIFPGVGALRDCMAALAERGLVDSLRRCAQSKPFLGICLGMQALLEFSEENNGTPGFGMFRGEVKRFAWAEDSAQALKVPHMGWNEVQQVRPHPLWSGIPDGARFYFVHSYYVAPLDDSVVAGRTVYGVPFAAAIARANVFAVQFHPEKSQHHGLQLLANFLSWDGRS